MPNDLAASLSAWRAANDGAGVSAAVERALEARAAGWCDDRTTRGRVESCGDVVLGAFESAIADLAKRLGGSTTEWKWGAAGAERHRHVPLGMLNARGSRAATWAEAPLRTLRSFAGQLFALTRERNGAADSVAASEASALANETIAALRGPTLRTVFGKDGAFGLTSTGQSGRWRSAHYADHAERFDGGYPVGEFARLDIHAGGAHSLIGPQQHVALRLEASSRAARDEL